MWVTTKNVKLIKRNCKRALTKERRGGGKAKLHTTCMKGFPLFENFPQMLRSNNLSANILGRTLV